MLSLVIFTPTGKGSWVKAGDTTNFDKDTEVVPVSNVNWETITIVETKKKFNRS